MRQSLKTGPSGSQQYERGAAPGSPSKRHPEANSHSISLHPIIPEETPADMGSAMSGRADHSTTNSAGQDAILSGGRVKANQKTTSAVGATRQGAEEDNSMVATESYGGAGNTGKVTVHDSTDRHNSTAKSQKRQQMQQQQQ